MKNSNCDNDNHGCHLIYINGGNHAIIELKFKVILDCNIFDDNLSISLTQRNLQLKVKKKMYTKIKYFI